MYYRDFQYSDRRNNGFQRRVAPDLPRSSSWVPYPFKIEFREADRSSVKKTGGEEGLAPWKKSVMSIYCTFNIPQNINFDVDWRCNFKRPSSKGMACSTHNGTLSVIKEFTKISLFFYQQTCLMLTISFIIVHLL